MRYTGVVESYWQQQRASCSDIGSKVVGTSAALEDRRGTEIDRNRSSWQGRDRHHLNRIVEQLSERRMRQAVVLVDQISEGWVDLEGTDLVGLEVAVAAVNTAGMAPVSRLISISAPGSTHWLSLYP